MKSKYKVKYNGFVYHVVSKDERKFLCECDTKHMAYKIKSALEGYKPVKKLESRIPFCWDCINENIKCANEPCNKCKAIARGKKLYFQPKEKK